ncbi:PilC/PilY family type IV pilus protein [Desulfoluna sp.]|uniref:PilC/PilY family type IV pilus protein n=1 Tax=Desulfoluna sp. TaxID=2045199 RepID=UPI002612D248|nr:PilC/PilY family type IV pilus protein [Desulfoluna sp.]
MGYHTQPSRAPAGTLPPLKRLAGLMLLGLLSFWLLVGQPAAHAVTLPFNDNFTGSLDSEWNAYDQTPWWYNSYHNIQNNSLRIISGGYDALGHYYTVYLDAVSNDFTATVQVKRLTNTDPNTKAGLIVQNSLGTETDNQAHIQVAASRSAGYLMLFDDNGDGTVDQSFSLPGAVDPPDIWLRLVRSGDTFTGLYSTDNATWTALGTVTSSEAGSDVNLGVFGTSGHWWWKESTARFDNFTLLGSAAAFVYFADSDGDTYGNPSASIVSSSATPPFGYVTDNTDCDDSDANTYPGATELCDGKDNNCDGDIDEGLVTTTFYRDADGDGYGTSTDTHQGCTPNPGYIATPGDCNDNNSLINPGAADICDNNIDEDCSGGDAACSSGTLCEPISDIPLSVTVGGSPAIIMFILDDSGSMEWSVMCPEDEGRFNGMAEYTENYARPRWKSQYHGYNRIYFNPETTYNPWAKSQANTFTDADFTNVPKHPLGFTSNALKNENRGSATLSLTRSFDTVGGQTITFGHYYLVSTTDSQPYLVDLGIDSTGPAYYRVTQSRGNANDPYRTVQGLSPITGTAVPADVLLATSFAEARTNFANWFTYHRTRETSTKASLGFALLNLSGVKAGVHTFNRSVVKAAALISTSADVESLLDSIYQVARSGYTPMRLALRDIGRYLDVDDGLDGGIGPNPFNTTANGGDCQQAFAILMTDGYGNGGSPGVGNADADDNTAWDGTEFYGKNANRLPDVAMYYYERDLSTALANKVPLQDPDYEAAHQRMVTYTVSFGIRGFFNQANYPNCPPAHPDNPIDCPVWLSGGTNEAKVDELWHAAANGRGQYINTSTPQELADAINAVLNDITRRTGTAASVAISSEKLDTGLVIYQGFFDSGDWSGNLEAYDVSPDGVVNLTAKWSAKAKLNAADWNTGRVILSRNNATDATVAFRHSNLSPAQKSYITANQVDFIRGDDSNEEDNSGTFRNRNSKLGDIAHSSPILHDGVVYVGANDGMFHAFDAETGNELFAYVPGFVYPNLDEFTSPSYVHKYYADGTATARTVTQSGGGTDTWVVSGLRKGGRGLFGINVNNPKAITETTRPDTWEYPTVAAPDDDMGYTYGEITFATGNDTSAGGPLIVVSNGYDSPDGHAVLLFLKLDGTLFHKIDTEVGSSTPGNCNGLSDPLVVDLNDDGKADTIYAGDLLGNLWKFDISSTDKSNWDVAFKDGTDNKPLFTARNSSGQIQPITAKPSAMFHCDATKKGTIVVFGTGRMLSQADLADTNVQTVYGIWDWQADWAYNGIGDTTEYNMGLFDPPSGTPAVRTLSNIDGNSDFPSNVNLTLLQQTQTSASDDWRYTSNNPVDWFSPENYLNLAAGASYTGGTHIGWYLNLPETKERVITKVQIRDGKAYIVSIIPIPAPCASGGTTVGTILNACNGGQLDDPQWDTNNDGVVDDNDSNPSGKKFDDDIYYAPAIIEDKLFFTKDRVEDTADEIKGLFYWRIRD